MALLEGAGTSPLAPVEPFTLLDVELRNTISFNLELIGDAQRAEALVMEAIENLNPENVTGEALRYAVVELLVRAQMMSSKHSSMSSCDSSVLSTAKALASASEDALRLSLVENARVV